MGNYNTTIWTSEISKVRRFKPVHVAHAKEFWIISLIVFEDKAHGANMNCFNLINYVDSSNL